MVLAPSAASATRLLAYRRYAFLETGSTDVPTRAQRLPKKWVRTKIMTKRAWIVLLALLLLPGMPGLADAKDGRGHKGGHGYGSGRGHKGGHGSLGARSHKGGHGRVGRHGYRGGRSTGGHSYNRGHGYSRRHGYKNRRSHRRHGYKGRYDHHGHGYRGYGRGYRGGWWGYWGYPAYGYGYPYVYPYVYPYQSETRVVIEEQPVYIERPPSAAGAPSPPEEGYWHYCESAAGYYPDVPSCPEDWIKVPPRPE